jgi:hypothetical protein
MVENLTALFRIANKEARIVSEDRVFSPDNQKNYFIQYIFTEKDTKKAGHYIGEFKIDFFGEGCGKLTLPNDGRLNIIVKESITKTEVI